MNVTALKRGPLVIPCEKQIGPYWKCQKSFIVRKIIKIQQISVNSLSSTRHSPLKFDMQVWSPSKVDTVILLLAFYFPLFNFPE